MIAMVIVFVVTIMLGVPISFCLGLASVAFILFSEFHTFNSLPTMIFGGINSFPLMAIPFFIMAGDIMGRSGVLNRLIDLADALVGRLRGGLAYVNILASMFFAGVSGVAVADTAAIGSMLIPGMRKQGYSRSFSASVTAASSIVGPVIPPSVAMLIYAHAYGGGISVAKLFLMGAVPGIILAFSLMLLVYVMGFWRHFPVKTQPFSWLVVAKKTSKALPGLMVPVIILGGIVGGIFTPTEAGAIAVSYAILEGFIYERGLTVRDLMSSLIVCVRTTAVVFMLLATARIISWILVSNQVPQLLADFFTDFTTSTLIFLTVCIFFILLLGFVMEAVATMIMLVPVLAPVAESFGVDPHHFGLIVVMTVQVALITPPVALGLFICTPMAECSMEEAVSEIWPFWLLIFAVLLLIAYFPGLSFWLPALLGY